MDSESPEEKQQTEITALKSIYDDNFIECPPPKAWKGAPRLPEFIIKVHYPDAVHTNKIYFNLHVTFPKTYPDLACPTFAIRKPILGLKPHETTKLSSAIHAESQRNKGSEQVFQIVTFAEEWMLSNVKPPVEVVGSLATQMTKRAIAEEHAKRLREEAEAEEEQEREAQRAEELRQQIRADAERQQLEREKFQRARKRAMSDATEVPPSEDLTDVIPTESFPDAIEWEGVSFTIVKLFHPKKQCLGTMWQAEPVSDEATVALQLELLNITFESSYYSKPQGQKKLQQTEAEIKRLTSIRHTNLLAVLAVKLIIPRSSSPPRLVILCEGRPAVTLQDVLEDCDCLREDRATDYLNQILSVLYAIHNHEIVHRGLSPKWIALAPGRRPGESKLVKLYKTAYHVRLLDMHRSNPFGGCVYSEAEDPQLPEGWLPKEVVESPLVYTKSRDIHAAGVILLQMLLGVDVVEKYPDVHTALKNASLPPYLHQIAVSMLVPGKKNHISCSSLLAELNSALLKEVPRSPVTIPNSGPKTPMLHAFNGSPESDYFRVPAPRVRHSRWKEDWEELELLGKGAFGSVVKARNKIDERIYAVKKIRLRATQSDSKIFREVNALSRLNHRFIVRYYTTWVETSDMGSTAASSVDSDSGTSVPASKEQSSGSETNLLTFNLDDLGSDSRQSFPDIRFTRSGSPDESSTDPESDEPFDDDPFMPEALRSKRASPLPPQPTITRTLYIQMEFVERQTLKERIAEGISEEEAWRLFQQIVDALVHMSSLGILHRDIKLTNIFIDGRGDCKVGDFGLATSSLAAVDPSDRSLAVPNDADMTLDVGTRLYIAPEVQSSKGGPRNHAKADMYSLGIVFFEMNYVFCTGAERIAVLEDLRKPDIRFPTSWEVRRSKQRQIITWLLQHHPNDRPTALELSQSSLLPPRMQDDYFKNVLNVLSNPDSPHLQSVLSILFSQTSKPARGFLYDADIDLSDHATLNGMVHDRIVEIFRLHGAIDMEPALLLPVVNPEDDPTRAVFLDRHGDVVALPNNALAPFARLAARANIRRIKRYHIGDIYKAIVIPGHPKAMKAAVFDIITPDVVNGQSAAVAEAISVVNSCLEGFANLNSYEIHLSHTKIFDVALGRVSTELRSEVMKVMDQSKSSQFQKRSTLLRKGVPRNVVDELEVLMEIDEDVDAVLSKLEKVSPHLIGLLDGAIRDIKNTLRFAAASGVTRPIFFHPLFMMNNPNSYFKDGLCFEVVRRHKRSDILALGGRYDHMITRFSPLKPKADATCAVAVQIALDKITVALASFQSATQKTMLKERRSYGYWSPRRCDVYVVSHQEGYLSDRLEVTALLWQNGISADLMYEFGLHNAEHENVVDQCSREGILFIVYPRPRTARRDQPAFKVKSVLKGTEYEVSRSELVSFLHQQIAEQQRIDASLSGVSVIAEGPQPTITSKEISNSSDVQLILPGDSKKQRKQTKQMFLDRAFEFGVELKNAIQSGLPIIAADVPLTVFEDMAKNTAWVTDEEAWKAILGSFPPQHVSFAHQVREAVSKRKADGAKFVILFGVREERASLLDLT